MAGYYSFELASRGAPRGAAAPSGAPDPGGGGDQDWIARSTATGVELANRLDSSGALTDWLFNDSTADHVTVDTTVKPTNATGSFKFAVLNADDTASGAVSIPFAPKVAVSTIWFSFRIRADDNVAYQAWTHNLTTGIKLAILSRDMNGGSPTGSNQVNEVVPAINYSGNNFEVYHQDGAVTAVTPAQSAVTACSGSDLKLLPLVDRGASPLIGNDPATGSAWTACQQDRGRYGGLYSAFSLADYLPGLGDPLSGARKQDGGVWFTYTCCVNVNALNGSSPTNRIRVWVAEQGQPYDRIIDMQNVVLGAGPAYNGLNLLPYVTNRSPGGRKSTLSGISGVTILSTGGGTAIGDGSLEYVASTGAFRFKAINDAYGTARFISAANGVYTMNLRSSAHGASTTTTGSVTLPVGSIAVTDASAFPAGGGAFVLGDPDTSNPGASNGNGEQYVSYTGKSGNTLTGCTGGIGLHNAGVPVRIHSYIAIRVDNVAALPGSGTTTATVSVSEGRRDGQVNYADVIISSQPINAPGGYAPVLEATVLAQTAAAMAPGTWAALPGVANQNAVLGVGPTTGSALPFMNGSPWYQAGAGNGNIHIIAMDHNYAQGMRDMVYSEATNSFTLREEATVDGTGIGHGYDHSVVNPYNGDLYLRRYALGSPVGVRKKVFGTGTGNWTTLAGPNEYAQVAIGSCWWKGSFTGGGAQGTYLLFTTGEAVGRMMAYNPLTDTWFFNSITDIAPGLVNSGGVLYGDVMEYSAVKNVAVYGGCGEAPSQLWKMASDRSVTALTNVPSGKSVGISRGNFVCDPVTGNFILLSAGQLWELNPNGSGTWTQQTGSRAPPSDVGNPVNDYVISCAIPEYGVIAYIRQVNSGSGSFYLYKHA